MNPHVLCIDAYNFLHRARSGFTKGEWAVAFNFFRSLRSEVERHKPTRVIMVTEGTPRQLQIAPDYKANRAVEEGSEKHKALVEFHRQKTAILNILSENFPVSVMRHPNFEADDTIYNLIKRSSQAIPWTVVSTDTDFIQLLNEFSNVTLYNPVKKENVAAPTYDYVTWKALRGDETDNIKGVPRIGNKTAEKLVLDDKLFEEKIINNEDAARIFFRNVKLIKLAEFEPEELTEVTSSTPTKDWNRVAKTFEEMGFRSLLKEKAWNKFTNTFEHLWGC